MSWIRGAVKGLHLMVLLLVCGLGFYSFHVRCQQAPPADEKQDDKSGALTIVNTDDQDENDGIAVVEIDDEIIIENPEPFTATNEWQTVKPGQAIPRGLHVRMNVQTGEKEARLLQEENQIEGNGEKKTDHIVGKDLNFDELKKAVKSMKSEKFQSLNMETLRKEQEFRSYNELKEDMESMNADVKTDAEVITELVEQFRSASSGGQDDVMPILSQLEYYLHQIDNAMLFCDLGAMPVLLKCLNNSQDQIRSEAALTLGSAVQSNPKVQISAIENGAMQEVLRLLAIDSSPNVRKRALYALSTMIRHFPFAQKRFLQLGGLSVLGKLFEDKASHNLQVRAVTLLADLLKEKMKHIEHADMKDESHKERIRQYQDVKLEEAMVETGWCSLIPSLLGDQDHDSREKVLVAMETILPACRAEFQKAVPKLRTLLEEYREHLSQEMTGDNDEDDDDGFFKGMVSTLEKLLGELTNKDEL